MVESHEDSVKKHIQELYKLISELDNKEGLDKDTLLDFLTVVTSVIVKLNQGAKKLN